MRWIVGTVIVLAVLWTGWWWAGSTAQATAFDGFLESSRGRGWVAEAAEVRSGGFPFRFELRAEALRLDPPGPWGAALERFVLVASSYQPTLIIAELPGPVALDTPAGPAGVEGALIAASLRVAASTTLALRETRLDLRDMAVALRDAPLVEIAELDVATQALETPEHAHRLGIRLLGLELAPQLRALAPSPDALPEAPITLDVDATFGFDGPVDRTTLPRGGPLLTGLRVDRAELTWGTQRLSLTGDLREVGGYLDGTLEIEARGWRAMLATATELGAVDPGMASTIRSALATVTLFSADDDLLRVPLTLSGGRVRLLGVGLADAPRLR